MTDSVELGTICQPCIWSMIQKPHLSHFKLDTYFHKGHNEYTKLFSSRHLKQCRGVWDRRPIFLKFFKPDTNNLNSFSSPEVTLLENYLGHQTNWYDVSALLRAVARNNGHLCSCRTAGSCSWLMRMTLWYDSLGRPLSYYIFTKLASNNITES